MASLGQVHSLNWNRKPISKNLSAMSERALLARPLP
jgi:hypothetical protein